MKLVLLVFNFIYDDAIRAMIERLKIPGFTEVPRVFGTGESGKRFGTHAFPGHDTLLFTVLPAEQVPPLLDEIRQFKAGLEYRSRRHAGIKAYVLGVEGMV
ncbi:MAG: PG0541 family transporter-associated protein [Candidatus Methylomirabilales bacterium]